MSTLSWKRTVVRIGCSIVAVALVACGDQLLEPRVRPNTNVGLAVWTQVTPSHVKLTDTVTKIVIRLSVENPSDSAIRVRSGGPPYVFGWDPAKNRGNWGSIRIARDSNPFDAGPDIDWWGDSVYVIPPRFTQYDEDTLTLRSWKSGGWAVTPGVYTIRGWFNGREGLSALFSIDP